jgi:hypothetical protein
MVGGGLGATTTQRRPALLAYMAVIAGPFVVSFLASSIAKEIRHGRILAMQILLSLPKDNGRK